MMHQTTTLAARRRRYITPIRRCKICGCHDDDACLTADGPCYRVYPRLCSACVNGERTLSDAEFLALDEVVMGGQG